MAATYRIVVSSINCYNSVVIDRRTQHVVHYCDGPCGALRHGLSCTVAHRSTCAEILDPPASRSYTDRPLGLHEPASKALDNGTSGHGGFCEDYHQVIPRIKKGLTVQSSTSLKDITGEAINLASGKIKEFSFEKIKYSSSHVTFRKGRKVRPDSFSRRSTDLDIIYGSFTGNDENCPPLGLQQKAAADEQKLSRSASLEQSLNSTATFYLNSLSEESLISRILEKTKADSGTSGEDIKACLDILLKCSEDLKKCTDIIKQCIKRKSMGGDGSDSGNPEAIYKNVMARLSTYLKRLPLELELGQTGLQEHSDLSELLNSLHGLQQSPFSHFGSEQPPRYEDIVHSPPPPMSQSKSSSPQPESQDSCRDVTNSLKPVQNLTASFPALMPTNGLQHGHLLSASSSSSPSTLLHSPSTLVHSPSTLLHSPSTLVHSPSTLLHSPSTGRHDPFSSSNSLLSGSSDSICKDTMEALYIEEDADSARVLDRVRGDGQGFGLMESRQHPTHAGLPTDPDKLVEFSRNAYKLKPEASVSQPYAPLQSAEPRLFSKPALRNGRDGEDDIDKLLMDLECLSQNMQKEPPLPPKMKNCTQSSISCQNQHLTGGSRSEGPPVSSHHGQSAKSTEVKVEEAGTEDDGALLLRILESIESFAQELVESGANTGTQSKEREVMRLLQDNLVSAKTEAALEPEPGPTSAPPPLAVPELSGLDTGSTILIQQTPEIIRIQPEKKAGSPSPALAPPPAAAPPSPPPPPSKVVEPPPPSSINIPRFHFPRGLPHCTANYDEAIAKIERVFTELEEEKADVYEMGKIAKACGCPLYWKAPMFNCAGGERTGFVSVYSFIATWRKLLHSCYDDASKFVYLLAKPGCNDLEQEDFIPLLQDIVDTHPGLTFLKDAPEFHSRYITTVIQRIFYTVNRSWTGRITMTELRRSNFLQTLALLEEEDDINQITDYFSYEHFYVIYCKFWELDTDHDLFIDPKDLARYNDHASSSRIIERLFSGAVTRGNSVQREGRMSYAEFVWFLISEEDKKNHTSVEYWFRCMDMDGDGVLSMYELEYFYEEQCERMEGMGVEPLPFQDLLCQMLDLVKPEWPGKITLRDLKRCRMSHIFFDTFFNLEKYLDHEQRDPFAVQKDVDGDGPEPSDWDKFAAEEYEILVAEETASEQLHEGSFEDDYETDEIAVPSEIGNKMDKLVISDLAV
ncbi:serine/threonine-protein phosphatase 2A regulatory subunit B'' subunit alpha isoform X1 [Brachyhypopomus gauderio]|uniref:serine/threonine-protein phosphatase 2A regulatory subunit B'' subunit alpha isoform X1 n=1 Tax=Brachyhypopomus gauderio TaxID=698409 RepID=UPI004043096D